MTITIYGIKSCDTMKKALTKLDDLGVEYNFHNYKKQVIDKDSVQRWVAILGVDKVLNKRGTTWRKLSDEQKTTADTDEIAAIELLLANTSMIKRPIVEGVHKDKQVLLCGFDENAFNTAFL
ncbi:Spx/MgsR family RNA polymerase-binding regulatory protein [Psychrobacter sp. CAL346-MNA-CIBAN-0220]|uniref:Spx/MgsR family RNA polymerase-binding regulatory protein n=1 Tax=Psychrobacter sp. CAL346-MNA-CIBAN-0220 TaxID=3140457 RepID=UPI00332C90E6